MIPFEVFGSESGANDLLQQVRWSDGVEYLQQLQVELVVTYETIHRYVERFIQALDAPTLDLDGPVEIDEVCVTAGKKGRERDSPENCNL